MEWKRGTGQEEKGKQETGECRMDRVGRCHGGSVEVKTEVRKCCI